MPLPSSGPITLKQIATEFGAPTSNIRLKDMYAGGSYVPAGTLNGSGAAIPSSGAIKLKDFYGAQQKQLILDMPDFSAISAALVEQFRQQNTQAFVLAKSGQTPDANTVQSATSLGGDYISWGFSFDNPNFNGGVATAGLAITAPGTTAGKQYEVEITVSGCAALLQGGGANSNLTAQVNFGSGVSSESALEAYNYTFTAVAGDWTGSEELISMAPPALPAITGALVIGHTYRYRGGFYLSDANYVTAQGAIFGIRVWEL